MFCPKCASKVADKQVYCRTCGLKLDAITREVGEQLPSTHFAKIRQRKERLEKLGVATLSCAALIGLSMLMAIVFYWKLILFGPDVLFWAATIAMIVMGLASVVLFNYPNAVMGYDKLNPRLPSPPEPKNHPDTKRQLESPLFEPASVTEHSTELLSKVPATRRSSSS